VPMTTYDEIADWYEQEFLGGQVLDPAGDNGDPLGIDQALRNLLGAGSGVCLDIGCGTGVRAARVSRLGWTPAGVDLSAGMLQHARGRLPIARADAKQLPVVDSSVPAAVSVMAHTDMPGYPAVLREVARVLRPGGVFVHVGVHPCFCGGFADRSDVNAVLIRPGYLSSSCRTKASWTDNAMTAQPPRSSDPRGDQGFRVIGPQAIGPVGEVPVFEVCTCWVVDDL